MPIKDHHAKPFDEGTLAKLEIFEDYAQAWIPTFVMQGSEEIYIFDFFAGPGKDVNGVDGSPIRILKRVREQLENIFRKNVKITLFFNEFDKIKFNALRSSCEEYLGKYKGLERVVSIKYFNRDFCELFDELLPSISAYPALVYLDQNGIKYTEKYITKLEKTSRTDFLCFVSSSSVWRFGNQNEFKAHLPLKMDEVKSQPYKFIHRTLIAHLKGNLPLETDLKLYPFTLKKGTNIYGIIFGASHLSAVDKFLSIVWKRNGINGEANFDIDDDHKKGQLSIFDHQPNLTKIEAFQKLVREKILNGQISNNLDMFSFVMEEGHIGRHAAECIKKMKQDGEISYNTRTPLLTYDNYKNENKLDYRVIKNEN
jgi:three-Cys-motif partner protein